MDCDTETIFQIIFDYFQTEITGLCQMNCMHCRGKRERKKDVHIDQILKIFDFVVTFTPKKYLAKITAIISGGEPTLHKSFLSIIKALKKRAIERVAITSNGLLINEELLKKIAENKFNSLLLSISLDDLSKTCHDDFRRFDGAWEAAIGALELAAKLSNNLGLTVGMRTTIRPDQIPEMEKFVELAKNIGCHCVAFSSVHPVGEAVNNPEFFMNKSQKKDFIQKVLDLNANSNIAVESNDPLTCLLTEKQNNKEKDMIISGCGAGIVTFNINSKLEMTPCALSERPVIMNTTNMTVKEIADKYVNSPIIKKLLLREFGGKCGDCPQKLGYNCGGCRVRALYNSDNYFGGDPDCWIN